MLEIEKTVIEMKDAFDELVSELGIAQDRISKLEHMSIETSKTKMQREKGSKNTEQSIQELWSNYKRCNMCVMELPELEREKQKKYLSYNG